jgi:hypothetical protein
MGLETRMRVHTGAAFVAVRAVSARGRPLGISRALRVPAGYPRARSTSDLGATSQ